MKEPSSVRVSADGLLEAASMEQALEYYCWSAENGCAGGQYRLVELYLEGERVPKDTVKAAGLLKSIANKENPPQSGRVFLIGC